MDKADEKRLRETLGGIEIPAMQGDNLAVTLCSHFEGSSDEEVDDNGWNETAITGCDETLNAIHAHYADTIAQQAQEIERLNLFIETDAVEGGKREGEAIAAYAILEREIERLREALNIFAKCAYSVATEINPRGHNWSEAYLDQALPIAQAALGDKP